MFKRSIVAPIVIALAGASLGAWALVTPAPGAAQALQPLTITKIAADGDHFLPGQNAYYQIEICNPNGASVGVGYINDTLPSGFSYVPTASGFANFDPDISGQTLSWFMDGEPVGGEQCVTTNFVVAIDQNEPLGMYCNQASVESDAGTSSTGPTAAMQILGEGDTQLTPTCPGGQKVRTATPTVTETEPPTATEAPATDTPVPPPPTATSPSGGGEGVISGPNTGSGPSAGGPSTLLLAIAAAMVAGGVGATAVSLKRR